MRWTLGFVGGCLGLIAFVLLVLWVSNDFAGLGLSGHGVAALILGSVLSSALAIGLMALVFHSDRSGQDERAGAPPRRHK